MTNIQKSEDKKFGLKVFYFISAPIITVPGHNETITNDIRQKYQSEAQLNIKEIFEKKEAPDYHALLQLSQSSLSTTPSTIFTKIQLQLMKKLLNEKMDWVEEEELEPYEKKVLLKLKKWIFKKQITHLKQKCEKENN